MSLKSDKGKPRHILPRPFRSGKVGKNLASFRDGHDETRIPSALILNLSGPPFVDKRPSGAIPEEACRGPGPLPKGAGKVRVDFPREKEFAPGLRPHNAGSLGIIVTQSFLENCPGDDPPCISTSLQSSVDPPFVGDCPPGRIPEEAYRNNCPSTKDMKRVGKTTVHELDRHNLKTLRTLSEPFREKWPGDDPACVLKEQRSYADPPFVEDRPPGAIPESVYQDPDPPPKVTLQINVQTRINPNLTGQQDQPSRISI